MAYGRLLAGAGALMLACLSAGRALAWSDEGHEVVAIIAKTYLAANSPATLSRVEPLLASDASKLTAHDIGAEAIWADKFRDSDRDTTKVNYRQTHNWHYININVADPAPDEKTACSNYPQLPAGRPASLGDPTDCVVDKIVQFEDELSSPATSAAERVLALKFLLHFVGDLHQPLHSAERGNDQGGANTGVIWAGLKTPESLRAVWNDDSVAAWGANADVAAAKLYSLITPAEVSLARSGRPSDWAAEAWRVAKVTAYALPSREEGTYVPPGQSTPRPYYLLPDSYPADVKEVAGKQLRLAGLRLAWVLEQDMPTNR